jgi:hypothetical protein
MAGGIALVMPYAMVDPRAGGAAVTAAVGEGAAAVVLVTTGPTGEPARSTPVEAPLFDRPVAVLAPREADGFVAAAARASARGCVTQFARIGGRRGTSPRAGSPRAGPGDLDAAVRLVRLRGRARDRVGSLAAAGAGGGAKRR